MQVTRQLDESTKLEVSKLNSVSSYMESCFYEQ